MRALLYISGILGNVFLTIGVMGYFVEVGNGKFYLVLAICTFLFLTLPLYIFQRRQYKKRKESILNSFKREDTKENRTTKPKSAIDYPTFSTKKKGLTWGGGNIHASTAKRGSKKKFLNH